MGILKTFSKLFGGSNEATIEALSIAQYYLNDPSTASLVTDQIISPAPAGLPFTVNGYAPNKTDPYSIQATNCYITTVNTINNFQEQINKFAQPVKSWASKRPLRVIPCAGKDFNAYYNRRSVSLFYGTDNSTKKTIYCADSSDIVAHELGHGLLDAIRPDLWNVQAPEVWAFHEAFGDITAIVSILCFDQIVEYMLHETDGDLLKSNVVSKLAEELGTMLDKNLGYLRDASVAFEYSDLQRLPATAPQDRLSAECHSFSRVFSSAWYRFFVKVYEKNGNFTVTGVKAAKDTAYQYMLWAVMNAPLTLKFTEAVAKNMLVFDASKGSPYKEILEKLFLDFKIIRPQPQIKMLSNISWYDIESKIKHDDKVSHRGGFFLVGHNHIKSLKLSDYVVHSLSAGQNPLYHVEMEVASSSFYQFDRHGVLVDESHVSEEEVVDTAVYCANHIHKTQSVGKDKPWIVEEGKLLRNFVICS